MKFLVHLTANGPVEALAIVEAESADQAGEAAVEKWRELDWEVCDVPYKNDIDTPCVDEYGAGEGTESQ